MWIKQIILLLLGTSAGIIASGGLFALIVELGVISDFADRTHTSDHIPLYEDCITWGASLGNIVYLFPIHFRGLGFLLPIFGVFAGIFVGGWAMALAEVIKVYPIFLRRWKIARCIGLFVIAMALGRGIGALLQLVVFR